MKLSVSHTKIHWLVGLGLIALAGLARLDAQNIVDGIAAVVNDKVITFSEVKKHVDATERLLKETYNGQDLVDRVKEARLKALNAEIERQLIIQDFFKQGYFVPENIVDDRMKDVIGSQFDGDRSAFIKTLLANGISLENYRKELRETIVVQYMRQKNVNTAVIISPYRIEQYYQENIKQFVQDDQIQLRLIFLRRSIFKERRTNTKGVEEEYDPQEEIIKEILSKLDTGSNFAELARSYSEGPKRDEGGDFGWVTRDTLRPELRDPAFKLKPGQNSRVITTDDGYYILRVEDLHPSTVQSMADARGQIEKTLIQEERQRLQQEWIDSLRAKAFIKMF